MAILQQLTQAVLQRTGAYNTNVLAGQTGEDLLTLAKLKGRGVWVRFVSGRRDNGRGRICRRRWYRLDLICVAADTPRVGRREDLEDLVSDIDDLVDRWSPSVVGVKGPFRWLSYQLVYDSPHAAAATVSFEIPVHAREAAALL